MAVHYPPVLNAFAKLRKATTSFVMCVRLPVRPSVRVDWKDCNET